MDSLTLVFGFLSQRYVAVEFTVLIAGEKSIMLRFHSPGSKRIGPAALASSLAVGLIATAGPALAQSDLAIYEIQGNERASAFVDQRLRTTGVVTGVQNNGFYLQDPVGDGDAATSDGIFVFTGFNPVVNVNDIVEVTGSVDEFFGKTEIDSESFTVTGSGSVLPTLLGTDSSVDRMIPTQWIDNDANTSFDPGTDGLDFYESLEGMLVTIPDAQAVGNTDTRFGEFYAVANRGNGASGMNARGGITIGLNSHVPDTDNAGGQDLNPERIQIDNPLNGPANSDFIKMGDTFGDITGVLDYNFNDYSIRPLASLNQQDNPLERETSDLQGGPGRLLVSSYNVLNLDPGDPDQKFENLADQIVNHLNRPDVIALQEMQDNNGSTDDGTVDGSETYEKLIAAIEAVGGPSYTFSQVNPQDKQDGGRPGANIRVGFLYNPDRIELTEPSFRPDGANDDPAFFGARKPLVGKFVFEDEEIILINNHFSSKSGSDPLFGENQPPVNGSEWDTNGRVNQALFVNQLVSDILADDPDANIVVLGDMNEFQFEDALFALEGVGDNKVLSNLAELIDDPTDLYSFDFEGNSQLLDHILVSENLFSLSAYDIVHLNTGFPFPTQLLTSDHDPLLAAFAIPEPSSAVALAFATLLLTGRIRRRRA